MTLLKMHLKPEQLFEMLWKASTADAILQIYVDGKEVEIKEVEIKERWNVGCITIDFRTDYT